MKYASVAHSLFYETWTWLTRPSPLVQQAEDRNQSRYLAILHIVAFLIAFPMSLLLGQPGLILVILVPYGINRAGYFEIAARLTIYGAVAATWIAAWNGSAYALIWMLIPLLTAVLLLKSREVILVAGLVLIAAMIYPLLRRETSLMLYLENPLSLLAISSVLSVLLARRWQQRRSEDTTLPIRPNFGHVLAERERLFRLLIENSAAFIYIWEPDTDRVPYFNKDGFLGYTREELSTPGFLSSIVHEDDWATLHAHWRAVLANQPAAPIEYRIAHKLGHWEWLERYSSLLNPDDAEGSQQVLVMLWRITERKVAEVELRQQEARNRALLDAIPDMIVRMDREGYYLQVWPFKKVRDHPRPVDTVALAGKNILDVLDREVAERILQKIQLTLDSDEVQHIEYQISEKDGRRSYEARWVTYGENEVLAIIRDVTQRMDDEARLAREAGIYHNLVEAIVVTEWVDDEFYVASMNKAAQKLYGWTLEEARGQHFLQVTGAIFPEDNPRSKVIQELIKTGHWSAELIHHHRNGTPIHVLNSASLLRDQHGNPNGIITIALDITHVKATEAALKIAEDRLYTALKRSPIVVSNQDCDLRYTWIHNPTADFDPESVLGKRDRDLLEDAEDAERLETLKQQVLERGVGLHREIQLHNKQEARHYQFTIDPLRDADGAVIGITCVQVDITESVQTELAHRKIQSLLQTTISNVPIIVWAMDKDGIITMSEGMGLQRIGQEPDEVTGESAFQLYADQPKMLYSVRRALNGESFTDFFENNQGTQYQSHFHPIYDQQGQIDGLVAVTIDLSERTTLEQNRLELALERERINMLQRFMGDVSHDFKTPLTSIKLSLHLLNKAETSEDRQRHLKVIEMQTERLESFMNDLFNMSRFDKAETNEFNFGRVPVNELVSDVIAAHRPMIDAKQHTLHWEPDGNLGVVLADRFQLDRVMTNLLVNAVHYTPEGGQIAVCTRQQERWAVIEIQDNGIGIPQADHERIFQRFYRGDPARSSDLGGMGVGLAIARKIVEAHGGQIKVESDPGQGSTFRVMIPQLGTRY